MVDNKHLQSHLDCITNKKIFIITISDLSLKQNSSSNFKFDLSYIDQCSDEYDVILIDNTTPYSRENIEEIIYDQLSQHTLLKPWLIITSDFKFYHQQHSHIIYYPFYLIDSLDKNSNIEIEIKNQRPYNICFLTYYYHWHRILVLLSLYQRMNFASCLINLSVETTLNNTQAQILKGSIVQLTVAEQQLVNKMFKLAPLIADPTDLQDEIVNIKNRAFSDSFINVFTESNYPTPFVTEKSIKPFLSGQFFAVLGHPSAYVHLKELGFDLFEDYIPMPQHEDFRQNLNELMNKIDELTPRLADAWNDTYLRRLHNYTLARSPELRNKLCYELCTRLNNI